MSALKNVKVTKGKKGDIAGEDKSPLVTAAPIFLVDGRINLIAMIQLAYRYSCNWRYQFNYDKTRVLVFGKCAVTHSKNKYVSRNLVFENSEYVNLGVFKNRFGYFHKNIDENITEARKKAGMLFSADFDRRRMNHPV